MFRQSKSKPLRPLRLWPRVIGGAAGNYIWSFTGDSPGVIDTDITSYDTTANEIHLGVKNQGWYSDGPTINTPGNQNYVMGCAVPGDFTRFRNFFTFNKGSENTATTAALKIQPGDNPPTTDGEPFTIVVYAATVLPASDPAQLNDKTLSGSARDTMLASMISGPVIGTKLVPTTADGELEVDIALNATGVSFINNAVGYFSVCCAMAPDGITVCGGGPLPPATGGKRRPEYIRRRTFPSE